MVRWIAFDDETAEAVVSRLRRGAAEIQHNTPVDAALHATGRSVIVLPSSIPGKLLVARFTKLKPTNFDSVETVANRRMPPVSVAPILAKKPTASVKKAAWWRKLVA
jgi:hypothetical protein